MPQIKEIAKVIIIDPSPDAFMQWIFEEKNRNNIESIIWGPERFIKKTRTIIANEKNLNYEI